ncbi:MAG: aminotransferase class V-fold PLP-dependent enzyme, partial [Chloroflexota bacterium]|nr:aminotransferase class V-fold PLP-dependent enzyme [Chloroflexota bacterium]
GLGALVGAAGAAGGADGAGAQASTRPTADAAASNVRNCRRVAADRRSASIGVVSPPARRRAHRLPASLEYCPMGIYQKLGVRPVINANANLTRLGGSRMPPEVLQAMQDAAGAFVDMFELQAAVSARIAALTHNEAALVCTGASAGLVLSALACMTGQDKHALARLLSQGPEGLERREIIMHCAHRIPYDPAIKLAGGRIVEVGNALQTFDWELEAAFSERTAAVVYVAGAHLTRGALPLECVVQMAHSHGAPVIVDAAAQLPPPDNLWHFTELGADLVVFSGGKALRGPQASGLIVGRRELIDACAMHASPNQRLGRPMKVGKEEMAGLLVAIERYLELDHAAHRERCERIIANWIAVLGGLPGVHVARDFPGEAGQPLPRAVVSFEASLGLDGASVRQALLEREPTIDVALADACSIYLNPDCLEPGEENLVLAGIQAVL